MAKTEVWKNKTKFCWIGKPDTHPEPELAIPYPNGMKFPPGIPVEFKLSPLLNHSNMFFGTAIGPEAEVRAELASLGVTIDEKQTKALPGGHTFFQFRGILRCFEDVSAEFAQAVEGFKLGGLEAAKAIVGKDKRIEELQAELAAVRKAAADKEAELAAVKASAQKMASKRLGL